MKITNQICQAIHKYNMETGGIPERISMNQEAYNRLQAETSYFLGAKKDDPGTILFMGIPVKMVPDEKCYFSIGEMEVIEDDRSSDGNDLG